MNRLWVWLIAAFSLITLVGVLSVGLLAEQQVSANFRHFFAQAQLQDSPLADQLIAYYGEHGTWQGVATVFDTSPGAGAGRAGRGMGRSATVLVDAAGQVVYSAAAGRVGTRVSAQDLADGLPLTWQDQPVGYLLVTAPGAGALSRPADQFLAQLNQTLLQAGLIAGGLAILLGLVIAWWLAAPLGRVATAARTIAAGDLRGRAPVRGPAEIAELARDFNLMAAGLERAEQARRHMVADIAHELRTPLSVLQGNLQALLDDVYPLTKTEIAALYDETLMLHRLVTDLYELAQAEAGHLPLAVRPIALGPLIERVQAVFTEPAEQQGIRLQAQVPAGIPLVTADPDRLRQVLHNLLANALRATPAGGTIQIAVEPGGREEKRPAIATQVCLTVADTGSGIAQEDLPHVFDRFWRAEQARSRGQGGAGLGLAIARQLVEAQGGRMGVQSTPGQGTRFWFTLPVSPPAGSGGG